MSKKSLISGAVIAFFIIFWLIGLTVDVIELSQPIEPILSNLVIAKILGWGITGYLLALIPLAFWFERTKNPILDKLKTVMTINATIPGHFIIILFPIVIGMSFALITGLTNWGLWLTCLSIPILVIQTALGLKKLSGMKSLESKDIGDKE